jgi:hypothetical protein
MGICPHQQALGVSEQQVRNENFQVADCKVLYSWHIPVQLEDVLLWQSDDELL